MFVRTSKNLVIITFTVTWLSACGADSSSDDSTYPSYTSPDYSPYPTSASPIWREGYYDCTSGMGTIYDTNNVCRAVYVDTTLVAPSGFVVVDGQSVAADRIQAQLLQTLKSARLNAGDREWNDDLLVSNAVLSIAATQESTNVLAFLGSPNAAGNTRTGSKLNMHSSISSDASVKVTYSVKFDSSHCVRAVSEPLVVSKLAKEVVKLSPQYLTASVFKSDCVSPIDSQGGLLTVEKLIAPGSTKNDVSTIMGISGLTITGNTVWTWSGTSRSPGCIVGEACSVTFDAAGRVTSTVGIKPTYLALSRW